MKKIILIGLVSFLVNCIQAQLKIGSNATNISTLNNLEVEALGAQKVYINKTDGRTYIENRPTALVSDSIVMAASNGEIRQISISRLMDQMDLDNDGLPNSTDTDDDGDGIPDSLDKCPLQYGCASTPPNGATHGCPVNCIKDFSSNGSATITSFDNCNAGTTGTMTQGVAVSGVSQTILVTVSKAGTYSITTTANGVTFSGSGTLAVGSQTIVLTASGTPISSGNATFVLNTSPNCSFTRTINANLSVTINSIGTATQFFDDFSNPNNTGQTTSASTTHWDFSANYNFQFANGGNPSAGYFIAINLDNTGTTYNNRYLNMTFKNGTFTSLFIDYADYDNPGTLTVYDDQNNQIYQQTFTQGSNFGGPKNGNISILTFSKPAKWMKFTPYSDMTSLDNVNVYSATTTTTTISNGSSTSNKYLILNGTISRNLNAGETVGVYRNGNYIGNATVSGTTWIYNENNVSVGNYSYTASIIQSATALATSSSYTVVIQ